ncbi:MAG: SDR family NAD(P)-dependent oxidoreductase [Pseudomonadota bacterium]
MTDGSQTALVTGANRGIGAAIAAALAARGIRVIAACRLAADAEAAAASLGDAIPLAIDLTDAEEAQKTAHRAEEEHGPIDILVNNAGLLSAGDLPALSVAELSQTLTVNSIAPFALISALAPGMRTRGWGRIVNVSSGWGAFSEGLGGPAAYAISKAALNAVTVRAARAYGPAVKVNAACPGWVQTRMGGAGATLTPEQGADTPVWLATLPDDGPTGGFFRERAPIEW